ncbi:MAG TPA: hypothetical protein VI479_20630, partial [Blastocatellia bacterium]
NSTFAFDAPGYLQQNKYVTPALEFHRAVFLTEQQARLTGGKYKWAGVLPRIQGRPGFTYWDLKKWLDMEYESLIEIGSGMMDILRIQRSGAPWEKDLFGSLRGFQLRSNVRVEGTRLPGGKIRIIFSCWLCQAIDRYDFDYKEYLTLPNPDYGQTYAEAIRPQDQTLTVYHKNAERLERAGLAAPFNIRSKEWTVMESKIIRLGEVDPGRRL